MMVLMKLESTSESIQAVVKKIESRQCKAHVIPGAMRIGVGITGEVSNFKQDDFMFMTDVMDVVRISKKFKLVSREIKNENTVISIGEETISADKLTVIAGPCSIESRDQIFDVAGELHEMGVTFFRAGAYKPRTSPYAFQGMKEKGLELLKEIKTAYGMKIVTEVKDTDTLDQVAETADILQIGARNMQNFSLLERVGAMNKPVLLKRGLSATIEDLLMSAEYILAQGNFDVILCERGIRTFETYTRNTLDLNAVPVIKGLSHLPVFVDPSHGIGIWDKVEPMAMAAAACGADGLMIEVHCDPANALSDGYQSLTPKNFKHLLEKLKALSPIIEKDLSLYGSKQAI